MSRIRFILVVCLLVSACGGDQGPAASTSTIDVLSPEPTPDLPKDVDEDTSEPELPIINPGPCDGKADGDDCDDSNACTTNDTCLGGFCQGGEPVSCDTSQDSGCAVTKCTPKEGCVQKEAADGDSCELPCFTESQCFEGQCNPVPGAEWPCEAPTDPCIDSYQCDPETGQCTTALYKLACPQNMLCMAQQDGTLGCSALFSRLCRPCNGHAECVNPDFPSVDVNCMGSAEDGTFCAVGCAEGTCPKGYTCSTNWAADADTNVVAGTPLCVPETDTCSCDLSWVPLKLWTECNKSNDYGACSGSRSCTVIGLTQCTAPIPLPESCDGVDNDCNGFTDDLEPVGCGPKGACCLSPGVCKELPETSCQYLGGVFQGAGFDCKSASCGGGVQGACCVSGEPCSLMTDPQCSAAGGVYQGDGYICSETDCLAPPQIGACCKSNGFCFQQTALQCLKSDGLYWGDQTSCNSVPCKSKGACCSTDGQCLVLNSLDCQGFNGQWWYSKTCDDIPCMPQAGSGACCLDGGGCVV